MWIAHDSARPLRVPQPKPTRVYPSPPTFRLTFTMHRRPPCRIHHLHITSQEQRHTQLCCQSLITQRERTSLGSSISPLMSALTNTHHKFIRHNFIQVTSRKCLGPSKTEANDST